jgi:ADP-heptose:LPS heptosyltransferase
VAKGFTERVCRSPEGYSIHEVSALLAGLDMLISPDTSLVHIARSFGVPVLGMYPRPEWNLNRWRPYGQAEGVVMSGDDGNIFDITPEQMIEGYRALRSLSGVSEL